MRYQMKHKENICMELFCEIEANVDKYVLKSGSSFILEWYFEVEKFSLQELVPWVLSYHRNELVICSPCDIYLRHLTAHVQLLRMANKQRRVFRQKGAQDFGIKAIHSLHHRELHLTSSPVVFFREVNQETLFPELHDQQKVQSIYNWQETLQVCTRKQVSIPPQ